MLDNNNNAHNEANDDDFEQKFHQSLKMNGLIFPNTIKEIDRLESMLPAILLSDNLPSAIDIINTGFVKIKPQIQSVSDVHSTWAYFFQRLGQLDLKKEFVVSRLLPKHIATHIDQFSTDFIEVKELVIQASSYIEDILGLKQRTILSEQKLQLNLVPAHSARYKIPVNIDQQKLTAYTIYVHRLATVLLEATQGLPTRTIPTNFLVFRTEILENFGEITFETALRYTWWLGIPVLPLTDAARFHGACWRIDGRNIIVLKQKTRSSLRWLFDLIHEVRHAAQHPEQSSFALLEDADDVNRLMSISNEEKDANIFAGQVLLKGKAIQLANEAIDLAEAKTERLKSAVTRIASREGLEPGTLANYLAFQLMVQHNINWWGTAMNLQPQESPPWQIAQTLLREFIDINTLPEPARTLLINTL